MFCRHTDFEEGYMLKVDLEYPKELNDLHNDYTLAPDYMVVTHKWFSEYQRDLLDEHQDITTPNQVYIFRLE